MANRTGLRRRCGRTLHAVRAAGGKFKDIHTYQRAHTADMPRDSKAEGATATPKSIMKKPAIRKTAKKAAKGK